MNRVLLEPPPTLSDERLAKLSAEGIDSAFAMLVLRHRRALVCHCSGLVGTADAEEVVQEALLRAYLALARGESIKRVGPWLRTIAHNTALNLLRAQSSRPAVGHEDLAPKAIDGDVFERRESLREVVSALEELPERQRQALVMRELEGRSYAEIQERLQTSNGAVRQLLNRARATVRERLETLAGLIPAVRWIVAGGGSTGTVARLGALSGGCAVTIKLCTAAVLPAVLATGAASPRPLSSARHAAGQPSQPGEARGGSAAGHQWSSRAALASRRLAAPASVRQLSAPRLESASVDTSLEPSQLGASGRHSRTPTSPTKPTGRGPGGSGHAPTRTVQEWATGFGSSAPNTNTPLQMGPNNPSGPMSPSGGSGSPSGQSSGSAPADSSASPPSGSSASAVLGSNNPKSSNWSTGDRGQPQPGLRSG